MVLVMQTTCCLLVSAWSSLASGNEVKVTDTSKWQCFLHKESWEARINVEEDQMYCFLYCVTA